MAWVMDHLGALITVAIVIAGWLNQRRRGADGQPTVDEDGNPIPRPSAEATRPIAGDDSESEVARRIREEIRRKIAERAGREPGPVAAPQETVTRSTPPPPLPAAAPMPTVDAVDVGEVELARQRRLAEQLAALQPARKRPKAPVLGDDQPEEPATAGAAGHAAVGSADALRRAVVMREVLGPPVALR